MTGTVALSTTLRISPLPPRGTSRSTYPRIFMSAVELSREVSSMSCTASSGSPQSRRASRMTSVSARLVRMASLPPLRIQTLPVFMQSAAASIVTFGRASYIIATTPRGTRICSMTSPFGRSERVPEPIGSARTMSSRRLAAMPSMRFLSSFSRSSIGPGTPFLSASSRSDAFASMMSPLLPVRSSAMRARTAFLTPVFAPENAGAAAFAVLQRFST